MNDKHLPPMHLDAAFSDIAESAAGAVTGDLTGAAEVHRLIKRSRRQRAAALGSAGFVLLGVAGIGLSGLFSPAPVEILPAPPVPSPTPQVVEPLAGTFTPTCGDDLSDLLATTTPLVLGPDGGDSSTDADDTGGSVLSVTNTSDTALTLTSTGFANLYLVDGEGMVQFASPVPEPVQVLDLEPGGSEGIALPTVGTCTDGAPPAAGTYSAVGMLPAEITPAGQDAVSGTVVGGPWTVTVDDTGNLTSIAGHTVSAAHPTTPPPTASGAESSVPDPTPIEVRDVLDTDTSAVFEALREAAATGAPASVDLFYAVKSDAQQILISEQAGSRRLTVPAMRNDLGRPRATSDDGWAMSVVGGAFFADEVPPKGWNHSLPFERLLGTYEVTLDESGAVPTFVLQIVEGSAPDAAPPTDDRATCQTFDEYLRTTEDLWPKMDQDLTALASVPLPAAQSPEYFEIRARWIGSPRVWWAMSGYYQALRAGEPTGDGINGACIGFWDRFQ
ncbi:hypothetical protein [Oerskovia enterophila]|uniref:hypothetical protein n=1 Tax=Oerskovia enterophila TaxID=43678 RepID=UPI003390BFE0